MSKANILFFTLLVLLSTISSEARSMPALPHVINTSVTTIATESQNKDVDEESCEGVGKDACLMRRMLDAHLDYIYTQEKKP
ncbi:hypothetical protein L2E82_18770 [Cichorium intybus]|uniref:Uncharacterized protein n=1 Tax=Cichorium intybus TaxID=13427 RepID=A0ACB9FBM6_CICIN|nr:hypothetical protein L2E82_18770 [Cichorium intybus]